MFWWTTILFLQEWRFCYSRSSKVIDFGTNRKRVCDFLLVRHSNLGPILHRFGASYCRFLCSWPHPYSTLFSGVFPLDQIAHVGWGQCTLSYSAVKLFSKYSNLCEKHIWTSQPDGQTTYCGITVLCVALHGKKQSVNLLLISIFSFWLYITIQVVLGLYNFITLN